MYRYSGNIALRVPNVVISALPKVHAAHELLGGSAPENLSIDSINGDLRTVGQCIARQGDEKYRLVNLSTLAEALDVLSRVLASGTIWLGIGSLISFFVAYTLVLSWADYSYVQPASAVAYAVVALLAHYMLREVVTPLRWMGVAVICLGVVVVGHTPPRTTEPN